MKKKSFRLTIIKFMFSKRATKIDEIFTVDLTLCSKCQIDGEDFISFYGLFRKHELYQFCISKSLFHDSFWHIFGAMIKMHHTF